MNILTRSSACLDNIFMNFWNSLISSYIIGIIAVLWNFVSCLEMDVEQKCGMFVNVLKRVYQKSFHEKICMVRSDQNKNISWFDNHLRLMREHLNLRNELTRQYSPPGFLMADCQFQEKERKHNLVYSQLTWCQMCWESFDQLENAASLFCDLKKLFHCVKPFWSRKLVSTKKYSEVTQMVRVQGVKSKEIENTVRVSQSSILGPNLFLI